MNNLSRKSQSPYGRSTQQQQTTNSNCRYLFSGIFNRVCTCVYAGCRRLFVFIELELGNWKICGRIGCGRYIYFEFSIRSIAGTRYAFKSTPEKWRLTLVRMCDSFDSHWLSMIVAYYRRPIVCVFVCDKCSGIMHPFTLWARPATNQCAKPIKFHHLKYHKFPPQKTEPKIQSLCVYANDGVGREAVVLRLFSVLKQ